MPSLVLRTFAPAFCAVLKKMERGSLGTLARSSYVVAIYVPLKAGLQNSNLLMTKYDRQTQARVPRLLNYLYHTGTMVHVPIGILLYTMQTFSHNFLTSTGYKSQPTKNRPFP